jgi:hypothetical protein
MDLAKKVIRKIRHKFKPPQKPEHPLAKIIAEAKAEEHRRKFWERDKKIVRDSNFKKALVAMELKREEARKEKERQAEIAEQRILNLKKARRKLKRIRNEK